MFVVCFIIFFWLKLMQLFRDSFIYTDKTIAAGMLV